jgi:SAM-dependent methyltransferase
VASFEELIAEGAAVPVEGWDFSWFDGRASEQRPPWGYARQLGERMAALAGVPGAAALDLETGGGEVLASIPAGPPVLVATETWPPNVEVARRNLARLGAEVVAMDDELDDLPFGDATFDLVVSRHPVAVRWDEVARVLKPGGTYFSQEVGAGSVRELTEFLMGPLPADDGPDRDPKWSVQDATRAGLEVVDLQQFRGRTSPLSAIWTGCGRCTSRSRLRDRSRPRACGSCSRPASPAWPGQASLASAPPGRTRLAPGLWPAT